MPESSATDKSRIRNIQIKAIYDRATITWISDNASSSTISYSTSQLKPKQEAKVIKTGENSFSAVIDSLSPGTSYHYTITSKSDDTNTGETYRNGTFVTRGYPIKITVRTEKSVIGGVSLSIKGQSATATTKQDGTAELELPAGDHTITALNGSITTTSDIKVRTVAFSSGSKPPTQDFTITLEAAKKKGSVFVLVITGIITLLMILAAIIIFIVIRRKKAAENSYNSYQSFFDDSDAWTTPPAGYDTTTATAYDPNQPISDAQYQTPGMQNGDFNYYQPPQEDLPENELFGDTIAPPPPPPPPASGNDPTQYPS